MGSSPVRWAYPDGGQNYLRVVAKASVNTVVLGLRSIMWQAGGTKEGYGGPAALFRLCYASSCSGASPYSIQYPTRRLVKKWVRALASSPSLRRSLLTMARTGPDPVD